ncbi:glycoside hydrolase domain-containing protein [Bacillus altitudinis]
MCIRDRPMWELAGNYTGTMIGYHAASLIADSYVKGYLSLIHI